MAKGNLYTRLRRIAAVRSALFVVGVLLMLVSPIIGILPGPGFIIVFPIGLALTLQNSQWAKRSYGRFKRRHPRYAGWVDRLMQRRGARLRRQRTAAAKKSIDQPDETPRND